MTLWAQMYSRCITHQLSHQHTSYVHGLANIKLCDLASPSSLGLIKAMLSYICCHLDHSYRHHKLSCGTERQHWQLFKATDWLQLGFTSPKLELVRQPGCHPPSPKMQVLKSEELHLKSPYFSFWINHLRKITRLEENSFIWYESCPVCLSS